MELNYIDDKDVLYQNFQSKLGRLIGLYYELTEEERNRLSERMKKLIAEAQEK